MSSCLEEQPGQDSEVSQNGQHRPGVSSRIALVCVWGWGAVNGWASGESSVPSETYGWQRNLRGGCMEA